MSKNIKIKLSKCPICGKPHQFVLQQNIGVYASGEMIYHKRDKKDMEGETMMQLFTCPVTNRLFQATIPAPKDDFEYDAFSVPDD